MPSAQPRRHARAQPAVLDQVGTWARSISAIRVRACSVISATETQVLGALAVRRRAERLPADRRDLAGRDGLSRGRWAGQHVEQVSWRPCVAHLQLSHRSRRGRFIDGFEWLDKLGQVAAANHSLIFRQTICGYRCARGPATAPDGT